jgi:thiamine pyrophosphate-dependent acetolactate synthase large subunit-like protein
MAQSSPETTTAALLAGYLHAAGVRHVFGYPGESVIKLPAPRH